MRTMIEPVMDDYDLRMEEALSQRQELFRESRLMMMSSMRDEDPETLLATYNRQIIARVAVRTVNDEYIEVIAAALPDAEGSVFRQTALERAYPRVFRPTPAQRVFVAAKELDGLSEEILQAIVDLERQYLGELYAINDSLVALIRGYEPENERYRAAVFALRRVGRRPDKPVDPTRDEFRRRDELDRRYIEMLRALLTEEQFNSLPGIQRFAPPKQKGARPGAGTSRTGGDGAASMNRKKPAKGSGLRPEKNKGSEDDGPK